MEHITRLKEFLKLEIKLFEELGDRYSDLKKALTEDDLDDIIESHKRLETLSLRLKILIQQREKIKEEIVEEGAYGKSMTLAEIASTIDDRELGESILILCRKYAEVADGIKVLGRVNKGLIEIARGSREKLGEILSTIVRKDSVYGSKAEMSKPGLRGIRVAEIV